MPTLILAFRNFPVAPKIDLSLLQIRKVDAKKIGAGWKQATETYFEVVFQH